MADLVAEVPSDIEQSQAKIRSIKERIEETQAEINRNQVEAETSKVEIQVTSVEIQTISAEVRATGAAIDEVRSQLSGCRDELSGCRHVVEREDLTRKLDTLVENRKWLETKYENQSQSLKKHEDRYVLWQAIINRLLSIRSELQDRLDKLRDRLDGAQHLELAGPSHPELQEFVDFAKQLVEASLENSVLKISFPGWKSRSFWWHPYYKELEDYIQYELGGRKHGAGLAVGEGCDEHVLQGRQEVMEGGRQKKASHNLFHDIVDQFHLVGTPGCGKSVFGFFKLHSEAKAHRKVVWRTDEKQWLYFDFSKRPPSVQIFSQYKKLDGWSGAWLIIDGALFGAFKSHRGPILQCVSPKEAGYKEFAKNRGLVMYLGAWSWIDVQECSEALRIPLTEEELGERFFVCGGCPRYLFDHRMLSVEKLKDLYTDSVGRVTDKQSLMQFVDLITKNESVSDKIFYYDMSDLEKHDDFRVTKKRIVFASSLVKSVCIAAVEKDGFAAAKSFFDYAQGISGAAGLSGCFFERHFFRCVKERDLEVRKRQLEEPRSKRPRTEEPPIVSSWCLHRTSFKTCRQHSKAFYIYEEGTSLSDAKVSMSSATMVDLPLSCFVEPVTRTQASWDAFCTPNLIFQVTVSLNHPVYWSAIEALITQLDGRHDKRPDFYELIFVVPQNVFDGFKHQPYLAPNGTVYKNKMQGMQRIRQSVVELLWKP